MPPAPTPVQRAPLEKLKGHKWASTICPPTRRGQRTFGTYKATLNHERTVHGHEAFTVENDKNPNETDDTHHPENHLPVADETSWAKIDPESHTQLTSEGLRQWEMHAHVDHVSDLVPFWQRGVDAAAKGKVLRLEEFLEKMEGDGGWRTANEVLEMLGVWKAPPSERGRDNAQQAWGENQNAWAASHHQAWDTDGSGWGRGQGGGWGMASTRVASDETELSLREDSGWGIREEWAQGGTDFSMGQANCSAPPPDGWHTRARGKSVQTVRGGGRKKGNSSHFVDDIARQQAVDEGRRKEMHQFFEMSTEKKVEKIEETIRFLRTHSKT